MEERAIVLFLIVCPSMVLLYTSVTYAAFTAWILILVILRHDGKCHEDTLITFHKYDTHYLSVCQTGAPCIRVSHTPVVGRRQGSIFY